MSLSLKATHQANGAILAQDGIPLHYGDLTREYQAALSDAILLDRSHEGRVQLFGGSRFEILNRMSTNNMVGMALDEGRPTIFTNPTARVIDRIVVYNRADHLLMLTEPGAGEWLRGFLQKNIFFGDDARLVDITPMTHMFGLHGVGADAVMQSLGVETTEENLYFGKELSVDDATIYIVRRKEVVGSHWNIIVPESSSAKVYEAILSTGQTHGLVPAGGLTYNTLRIRAGRPARPELNSDYIPLEIGLFDEISFNKGCYTGQEIIARMDSREKLAKTIVALDLDDLVNAPADITLEGKVVGKLTSSVQSPLGEIFTIAVLKTAYISVGTEVNVGSTKGRVIKLLGEQPAYLTHE